MIVAWVFFRAETLPGALRVLGAMGAWQAAPGNVPEQLWNAGLAVPRGWLWCAMLGALALFGVNSNRLGTGLIAWLGHGSLRRPLLAGATLALLAGLLLINITRDSVSAFIYFNF